MKKVKPCSNCPFRTDIDFPLRAARRREIADSLLNDQVFLCHKQLKLPVAARRPCVGSAMVLDKTEGVLSNVAYRLHCMLNDFPTEYNNDVPVFNSLEDFVNNDQE